MNSIPNKLGGDPSNYDLMINTTHISISEAIALLSAVYQAKAR